MAVSGSNQTSAGAATTQFLYEGDRLVAEFDGANNLARRYVHGSNADEPLVWYEGAPLTDRRWLHADRQGSIVATTNASAAATPYSYSAYGEPANDNWSGSRFRYTGQAVLSDVSGLRLYHYKARVYDPALGRFLQTDPVGYEDDLNLYTYVANDPVNAADPTGRAGELAAAGCAVTIEVGCAPGAAVGAIIEIALYGAAAACVVWCDDVFGPHPADHINSSSLPRPNVAGATTTGYARPRRLGLGQGAENKFFYNLAGQNWSYRRESGLGELSCW